MAPAAGKVEIIAVVLALSLTVGSSTTIPNSPAAVRTGPDLEENRTVPAPGEKSNQATRGDTHETGLTASTEILPLSYALEIFRKKRFSPHAEGHAQLLAVHSFGVNV
jgi:hypothetical protein